MTANDDLSRRLSDLYNAEAPTRAPNWLLEQALEVVDTTPQRRVVIRVPWARSVPITSVKLAAAVAVIAFGTAGLAIYSAGSLYVGGPPPSPSPSPSPSPALTESFTSTIHGISVSYPTGWVPKAATEPWTNGIPEQDAPFVDTIDITPSNNPFIALVSHAPGGDDWIADLLAGAPRTERPCPDREPTTIDGYPGVLARDCIDGIAAFVTIQDRGYFIWLYGTDDLTWFRQILATVRLHPEDAVGAAPSASP
ncbi:MAG TPA: hypothetical protein VIF84_07495 [Candidatus Limnocylindrales bacterium]|jgi:hypothetical protein